MVMLKDAMADVNGMVLPPLPRHDVSHHDFRGRDAGRRAELTRANIAARDPLDFDSICLACAPPLQ